MKKLKDATEMKKGGIYNLVYIGTIEVYARINGKRTILVTETEPKLQYVELYHWNGSPDNDHLRGETVTAYIDLVATFKEDDIFEPESEDQWFKHSAKVTSLGEAIELGLLTVDDIQRHPVKSSTYPFIAPWKKDNTGIKGVYTRFNVEDKTSQPLLQSVFVWWNTWQEMYADFAKYDVDARR